MCMLLKDDHYNAKTQEIVQVTRNDIKHARLAMHETREQKRFYDNTSRINASVCWNMYVCEQLC